MKIRWIVLIAVLCVGIFSSSMVGYLSGVREYHNQSESEPRTHFSSNKNRTEPITASANDTVTENVVTDFDETYVLKAYEGRLALFIRYANGDEQFHSEYDVSVSSLPRADRERLASGIEADTLKEAMKIVEDYIG